MHPAMHPGRPVRSARAWARDRHATNISAHSRRMGSTLSARVRAMLEAPRSVRSLRDPSAPLDGATVVIAVGGGIAAYKAAELVRLLDKAGARVEVAMTASAQKFIGPMTFQALTRRPCSPTCGRSARRPRSGTSSSPIVRTS
jgi:hypothetical protein